MAKEQKPFKLYRLPVLKSGKRLSWHKDAKGGRWCKKFEGKTKYFGAAKSKNDYPAYKAALKAAEAFVHEHNQRISLEREEAEELEVLQRVASRLSQRVDEEDALWGAYWASHGPAFIDSGTGERSTEGFEPNPEQEAMARARWEKSRRKEHEEAQAQSQKQGPITDLKKLLDKFLEAQKQRQLLTEKHPGTLPKKQQLSQRGYQAIEYGIKAFRDFAAKQKFSKMPSGNKLEKLLYDYREHHMKLLIDGACKKGTVTAKVRHLSPLFKWLHTHHHIDNVPRNLQDVSQQLPSDDGGKPVTAKLIGEVWNHADSRMKCFLALGLNCAMYTSEIAELKAEHLHEGYIAKRRRKTGAPYKIKLWQVTQDLIELHRDDLKTDTGELLFVTKTGRSVWEATEKGRSDSVAQRMSRLVKKHGIKLSWKQLRNTTSQYIEKLADEKGVGGDLTSAVLQHTDKRMAKTYLDQNPQNLPTVQLDEAIDELERIYDLKLDPDPPKAKGKKKSSSKKKNKTRKPKNAS